MNVERLKTYRSRLILFPRVSGQHKKSDSSKDEVDAHKDAPSDKVVRKLGHGIPIKNVALEEAIGEVKRSEMGKGEEGAYRKLRDARSDARLVGVREKRAKAKSDEASAVKK
ncbi:MAG: 60S ribosomal protein L13 [Pleopsidium flavum]|nr:MAG: 60S ribosomal protein L13 [Pleopsidium flavum]